MGHVEESRVYGHGSIWEDTASTPPPPAARPARSPLATATGGLHRGRAPRGLVPHPGACTRGARGVCGRPGAIALESTPRTAITPGCAVSAARVAPVPPVWLCLLRETPESQRSQGQPPRLCLLPLLGHRCVSLRRRTRLSEYPGADGSSRARRLAGSLYVAGAPGAPGGGISAPIAAGGPCHRHPPDCRRRADR